METLPSEVLSYIFRFLTISDRQEISLVCKKWYFASLDPYLEKDILFKCNFTANPGEQFGLVISLKNIREGYSNENQLFGRKLTHLALKEEGSYPICKDVFYRLLTQNFYLKYIDLSLCNSLFLSGGIFSWNETQLDAIRNNLKSVTTLKLACLKYLTDAQLYKLVSVMENLDYISLASNSFMFDDHIDPNSNSSQDRSDFLSSSVLNYSTVLSVVANRARKLKSIDLSHTLISDNNIERLCVIPHLCLEELILKGNMDITNKGIKAIVENQHHLQILDLSSCKHIGQNRNFFSTMANNVPLLKVLNVNKCALLGESDIQSLSKMMTNLRTLDLGQVSSIYEADLIRGICGSVNHLSFLDLSYCSNVSNAFVTALCQTNKGLAHLDLKSCKKITDTSLHYITRNLTSLTFLCLAYCYEISDLGLLGVESDRTAPQVRRSFDHDHESCTCQRPRESRIFNAPTGLVKQHQTAITNVQHQLEAGEELLKLSNLKLLKTLDLSSCSRITDFGITEAIEFDGLRKLSLEYMPKLTDAGVGQFCRSNPSLESVSVRGCGAVSDTAINSIATHLLKIRTVSVAQNDRLTDASVEYLRRCKKLKYLDASFCGNITIEAVANFEKIRPGLKVNFRPHSHCF